MQLNDGNANACTGLKLSGRLYLDQPQATSGPVTVYHIVHTPMITPSTPTALGLMTLSPSLVITDTPILQPTNQSIENSRCTSIAANHRPLSTTANQSIVSSHRPSTEVWWQPTTSALRRFVYSISVYSLIYSFIHLFANLVWPL